MVIQPGLPFSIARLCSLSLHTVEVRSLHTPLPNTFILSQKACGRLPKHIEEGTLVRWDYNWAFWPSRKTLCLAQTQHLSSPREQHPHSEAWWWQHHAVGMFFIGRDWETGQNLRNDGMVLNTGKLLRETCFSLPEIWDWDIGSPSSRTMTLSILWKQHSSGLRGTFKCLGMV